MKKLYVVKGNVRGQCAHQHRSLAGAVQCLLRDRVGARKQGGYSDREICYQDGRKLDESDYVDAMTIEARITYR